MWKGATDVPWHARRHEYRTAQVTTVRRTLSARQAIADADGLPGDVRSALRSQGGLFCPALFLVAVATMSRIAPCSLTLTLVLGPAVLVACSGGESKSKAVADSTVAAAAAPAATSKGETTYGQICASCHQATGLGVEGTFPPLKGSRWLLGDPSVPISIVIAGLQGEIAVEGKSYQGAMQPWGMLSDDDLAAVLTYARSQWGNSASAVTAEQVKSIRAKIGSRGTWTAEELKKEYPGAGT
jgi:mono/diheme cytochrome c family protein